MWGGDTSGVAGIATPYIQGSEAVYFNPAGLANDKAGAQDVSLNVSPTMAVWKAPIPGADSSAQVTGQNPTTYSGGLLRGTDNPFKR